jgi:hypothetical protein
MAAEPYSLPPTKSPKSPSLAPASSDPAPGRVPSPAIRRAGEELARRTRKAQGLPRHVRDRDVARRIAALLVGRTS